MYGKEGFYLCLVGKRVNGPKRDGKNPLERTGGHSLRPWIVYFIRDSEYKISGIKKLANKYARLDSFLVCPENEISVQLSLLQSLSFSSKHSRSALPFTP